MTEFRLGKIVAASFGTLAFTIATPALADAKGDIAMAEFAKCIVGGRPNAARALMKTVPASPAEYKVLDPMMAFGGCLGRGQLRMPRPLIRGAIAKALYARDFAAPPPVTMARPDAPRGAGEADLLAADVARCLAERMPGEADRLVRARFATPEEAAAFAPLVAAIPACAPASGGVRSSKGLMRARLAEAIYDVRSAAAAKR